MPSIPIYPPSQASDSASSNVPNLPQTIQTPSGLALLEIQGTIHRSSSVAQDVNAALEVGKLIFTDNSSRVYLYVGKHQRMTGDVKKLAKPVAVLRRRTGGEEGEEALEVAEIIKWKILFASRPEPVGGGHGAEDG